MSTRWRQVIRVSARVTRPRPRTAQTRRLAGIFGLGGGLVEEIFDDLTVTLEPGKLIAVTGPSGAGKSVLLRQVVARARGGVWLDVDVLADTAAPALDVLPSRAPALAEDLGERMELLSRCGLAEPAALLTPARRLSVGQRHRLALARLLWEARWRRGPVVVAADEFGASLDAATGRVLCRQLRRHVSRTGMSLLVATHRWEFLDDLDPDEIITKPIHESARRAIRRPGRTRRRPWRIRRGTIADYDALGCFHYLAGRPAAHKRVVVIPAPRADVRQGGPALAAVAVVSPPVLQVRARNIVFDGRHCSSPRRRAVARLNREVETISRVVVHPIYRGEGLSIRLVRHVLRTRATPIVEALAIMGRYHPFFARAGMREYLDDQLRYAYYYSDRRRPDHRGG